MNCSKNTSRLIIIFSILDDVSLVYLPILLPLSSSSTGGEMSSMLKCLLSYLLHFLDIEWKATDYNFVADLNIPNILVSAMQGENLILYARFLLCLLRIMLLLL